MKIHEDFKTDMTLKEFINKKPREIYEILEFSSTKYSNHFIFKEAFTNVDIALRNILQIKLENL